MTHYKKKKIIRLMAGIIVLLVTALIWMVNFIDVNRRFPKAIEEIYHIGEDVEYRNFIVKVNDISYVMADEAKDKYGIEGKKDFEYFIINMCVTNESDLTENLEKEMGQYIGIEAYPIGYDNQGEILCSDKDDTSIAPRESKEVIIYFVITNGMVREDRREMLKKSNIYLDFSNYPVHKAVIFENIKGL